MQQEGNIDYSYYLKDIQRYKKEFEDTIQDIYDIINEDLNIYQIEARIKSYKSFMNNLLKNDNNSKIKNLDDCFGIKVMLENDQAIKEVLEKLKKSGYNIREVKDHKKKVNTNYNAIHTILELKESKIPFEIQLRTPERAKGRMPHDIYKMCGAKKDITYNDKIKVMREFFRLAKMKMNGQYRSFGQEIPICYRIKEGKIVRLNTKEVIKNLFPTAEEIIGDEVFDNILDKLSFPGIQERKNAISEKEKEMLNILFDHILQKIKVRGETLEHIENDDNEEK